MKDKFIIESFYQKENNCAVVAIIKAAIIKFGIGKVFTEIHKEKDIEVILQNGKKIILKKTELVTINKRNGILLCRFKKQAEKKHQKQLRQYVNLCFAVILSNMNKFGFMDFEYTVNEARKELISTGINTDYAPQLLGLKRSKVINFKKEDLPALREQKATIMYNNYHTVIVSNGLFDNYGSACKLEDYPLLNDKKVKYWYYLK